MLTLLILTGIALTTLLVVLGWALAQISRALASVTITLQKIAMGVRAIEQETSSLKPQVVTLNQSFGLLAGGFDSIEQSLRRMTQ